MYMVTYTGARIYFDAPESAPVFLRDIAAALAMTCRFGGHCDRFYSVAEHSINVARCVLDLWPEHRQVPMPLTRDQALAAALMHDAAEAYMCDLPSPLKAVLPGYKVLEKRFDKRIREVFDLVSHPIIKEADRMVLSAEADHLLPDTLDGWADHELTPWERFVPWCWNPHEAQAQFLEWAYKLGLR